MIAYNKEWLYSRYVQRQADEALHERCIDEETHETIMAKHKTAFYTPNFFVRIGLALLTLVILIAICSFFSLVLRPRGNGVTVLLFIMGAICYVAAEAVVRRKGHYNSGVDNMLAAMAAVFAWLSMVWYVYLAHSWYGPPEDQVKNPELKLYLAAFVFFSIVAIRFADMVMSILATIGFVLFIFFCYKLTGNFAKATTPFAMMLATGSIWFLAEQGLKVRSMLLYHKCLKCVRVVAMLLLYGAGNYYLVRELSNSMFDLNLQPQDPLPMGWFFWGWIVIMPAIYIVFGILKRNVTYIRVSLPLIVFSVMTVRYYHAIMSAGMAMLLGGAIVFVVVYALINYLRAPRGGFTFSPETYEADEPDMSKVLTGEFLERSGQGGPPGSW